MNALVIELTDDQRRRLDAMALSLGRPAEALVLDRVHRLLAADATWLAAVENGRRSLDEGDTVDFDDFFDELEREMAADPRLAATSG
jgi:predicted transcriptional regulator